VQKHPISYLSIVIPVYNESQNIEPFYNLLDAAIAELKLQRYEIIYVNDGSSDDSLKELKKLAKRTRIRVIELTRNFGKEAAVSAGLHNAAGDCVLVIDGDGQHPANMIKVFIDKYSQGFDMVIGVRSQNNKEKLLRRFANQAYYSLLKLVGVSHLQPRVTDFRLMSREVVDEFCKLTERRRITRGLLSWMGYESAYIEFDAPQRLAGKPSYDNKKLFYLAVDSILSNSRKPLAVSFALGIMMSAISLFGIVFILVEDYLLN
jgi:polyisoprenyl-phosphate glycosyltransferase